MAERATGAPIRVVVADDSWHYARALEASLQLEADIDVVAVAYSAEETIDIVGERIPDVVLLDLDLPQLGGVGVCARLHGELPDVRIVIVTATADEAAAQACIAAGARAYVVKHDHTDPERIAAAVRSAARGDHVLDRSIHPLIQRLAARAPDPAAEAGITPRELEILPLMARGLQNKQIAVELEISLFTVRNHLHRIYEKLGTSNRTETITEARRRGILP